MARLPADRLSTRAASISADLTSSLADLDTRRQEELKDVSSLSAILRRARGQPQFASDALDLTLAGLDQATTQAMSGNVSAASSTREKAIADLVHTLRVSSDALEAGLQPILAVLKDGSLHLAAEAAPQAQQTATDIEAAFNDPAMSNDDTTPAQVLDVTRRLRKSTTEITIAIIPSLHSLARETLDILSATPSTELGPVAALQRAAEALIKWKDLDLTTIDSDKGQDLAAALRHVVERTREAIVARRPAGISEQQFEPVAEALEAGAFRSAAALVVALAATQPGAGVALGAGGGQRMPLALQPMFPALAALGPDVASSTAGASLIGTEPAKPLPSLSIRLQQARRSLALAQVGQSLVLGLVLLVIAFVVYAGGWTGSASDIAAVFLWAFTVDVTVDAVVTAAKTK